MKPRDFLTVGALIAFANFSYQFFTGEPAFMTAVERTYFMWLALLLAWFWQRKGRQS